MVIQETVKTSLTENPREQLLDRIFETYSPEEQDAITRVRRLIGVQPFGYIDTEPVVTGEVRIKRQKIIENALKIILDIRRGTKTLDNFWEQMEPHFTDFDYRFVVVKNYPGINVRGTGVLLALIQPVVFGKNISAGEPVK